MYTYHTVIKIDRDDMTWDRWQGLLLLILSLVGFTVGDGIGWLLVILGFILFFGIIYLIYQIGLWYKRRSGHSGVSAGGRSDSDVLSELFSTIRKLDARIAQLEEELAAVKQERNDAIKQAHRYNDLQREISGTEIMPVPEAPPQIKVLLVVPKSNLPLADAETQDVQRSGLLVTPVLSPVSQVTFTREILSSNHDGLWLAGHMNAQGDFLLDGGDLISPSALTSLVRGRFQWVFLNSCQSIFSAQSLQNETEADVVCTVVEVPDIDAYRTGALFANWLSRLGDVRAAYDHSRPGGNRVYVYLSSAKPRIVTARS